VPAAGARRAHRRLDNSDKSRA